jgi:hypothetical protein
MNTNDKINGIPYSNSEVMLHIRVLTQRVDKHSEAQKEGFERLYNKIDNFADKQAKDKEALSKMINDVKYASLKDSEALKVKLAVITGAIGIAAGGAGSVLGSLVKKMVE